MFFVLFFCAELIEEMGGARNVKFGTRVDNIESMIKFEDLRSEIFTSRRDDQLNSFLL